MANKVEELKKDIAELESIEKLATRQKIKDILSIEIRKLVSEVIALEEQAKDLPSPASSTSIVPPVSSNKRYEVKLSNYAWDQSNKFVKFYITLKNVHNIPPENVKCEFASKGLELTVKDLDNKDYVWKIRNLLNRIDPEKSNWKIKTDMVLVNAAKRDAENWSYVTEWEKKSKDSLKVDTEKMDPAEGIMSLMQNLYSKGDDQMKQTIAKAWTESQAKGHAF